MPIFYSACLEIPDPGSYVSWLEKHSDEQGDETYMASPPEIPMCKTPAVSFVVVNWNGRKVLADCLHSIHNVDYPIQQVIVSDNGSTDGSIEMVRERYPDVVLIENGKNYGAPIARNFGIRKALESGVDFIYCLDNDLIIDPKAIRKSLAVFDIDERIAMVGSLILDREHPGRILSAGGIVNWTQNLVSTLGMNEKDTGKFRGIWNVDYAGSGALMTRAEYIHKNGAFDEGFIGYGYEDTDFGIRANLLGYRVVCCAEARVWHRPHSGIGRYTFKKKYLEARNAIRFVRMYGNHRNKLKFMFFAIAGLFYATVREGARGNIMGVIGKAQGLYDGLRGREDLAKRLLQH
jgi:GT2 family glycosyltransferase